MHGEQEEITILHVDDEPDFLALTKALLERGNKDYRVDSAASAEEGMELLKSGKYDIVISDYQMPVMDGLEFLQKLRARGSTIPFIIFTGRGREEVAIESLNRGASHYLQKGGDRESLYGTLAHVVREEVAKQRAEDKLVEKERESQTLLDSLPLNIFHIDRQNTFVHVNEVLAKHYGMKPEDFKGKTTKELFPEETKAYTKSDKEVLESGKPQIGVRRKVVTPQGVQWVRLDKVPVKDADGNVTGLIGFELDVTEQKRMEDELQESEQRLNSFMDSATDFFTLWDSGLNLVDINKAALGFFAKGTKKEELRGQHILDIVPYITGTDAYDKFNTVIKAGEPLITDYLIQHPELGDLYLTLRAFKVGDGLGVIFRDITERKRAGEQLGKIIEGSTIPTFVINSEHKLTHWNAAVEALTGVKREEIVGTDKQWIAFYPEKRPVMADLIIDGAKEREFKKKYGSKYKKSSLIEGAYEGSDFFPALSEEGKWLDFSAAPIKDSTGSVIAALETLKDVTDQKRAEEELRSERDKFQGMLSAMVDGVDIINKDYIIEYQNDYLQRDFGDLRGKKCYTAYMGLEEPCDFCPIQESMRTGKKKRVEFVVVDGRVYELRTSPFKDVDGEVKVIELVRDITEHKQMLEKLKQSEKEHQMVLDSVPVSIFHIDRNSRFVQVNEVLANRYGMKPEDFKGKTTKELFPEQAESFADSDREVLESGEPQIGTLRKIKTSQGVRWVRLDKVPIKDAEGNVTSIIGFELDVTEREQIEEKLREREREHQTILDSVPASIFHIDRNSTFVQVNKTLATRYGKKPEDFKGKSTNELFPEQAESFVKSDREVLESGEPQIGVRKKIITPLGVRWMRIDKVPVKDADGNVTDLIGFELDVTNRKQTEEALRESEERFRSIVENSHDGILIINDAYQITYVNDELCRILGYSREESIGQDFRNFLDEESKQIITDRYIRRQKGENIPARYEFNIARKDGAKRRVEICSAAIKDSAGNVQTVAQILDITERKRAVEKLRQSEKEHQMILDSVPVSIFHIDRNSTFLQVNETLAKRYGMKPRDFKGKTTNELFPEQAESFAESDREVLESGEPQIGVIKKIGTPQGVRWVRLDKVPIKDAEGNVTGVVGFELDITDRKTAEDERKRLLKELEEKNSELEHFTYTVSHDLRSPLVTIQGFIGLLAMDLERDAKEKAANDLKYISSAATKMDELLNATLELSRIGRIANPPEDVPFGAIVEGALQQAAGAITANNIEVSVVDGFPVVHVDRMRMEEVLVNLITNSIKYRGEQPHPKIEIGHRVDGEETVFFVKDNGIGLDKIQHEEVFELFYQVSSGNGTGAGLAIVKRIVEVHEGRIWIESEKGKGCTVCFTLPVN